LNVFFLNIFPKKDNFIFRGLQLYGDSDEILFKIKNIVDPFWASACSALVKV
jgi:hypothetical protein